MPRPCMAVRLIDLRALAALAWLVAFAPATVVAGPDGRSDGPVWGCEGSGLRGGEWDKLPAPGVRDLIFRCSGVSSLVSELDYLDKDMLFMRSSYFPLATLAEKTTLTTPPRRYGDLIPMERLARLRELVLGYFGRDAEVESVRGEPSAP